MTKIAHNYQSQEQSIQFGGTEVQHASTAADDTVTSGKVTLAGLGEDMSGATELISNNSLEYERAVEYQDLAQLDLKTDQQAHNVQTAVSGKVGRLFGGA
jgi:hypothetical protein